MTLKSWLAALLVGTCLPMAAPSEGRAESKNLSATYGNCMNNSNGVTFDMIDCMTAEHTKQDARLNAAYKSALKAVGDERGKALRDVQRAWLKFRELSCGFAAAGEGQIARIEGNSCMLHMTADRADELELIARQ